ncbi:hypothetical protein CR513_41864, partial [Mucuna pruriens]
MIILTPYYLPLELSMKREFMFLTLFTLWNDHILTYGGSLRQNFMMKATLMWTINDFLAYGSLVGPLLGDFTGRL